MAYPVAIADCAKFGGLLQSEALSDEIIHDSREERQMVEIFGSTLADEREVVGSQGREVFAPAGGQFGNEAVIGPLGAGD